MYNESQHLIELLTGIKNVISAQIERLQEQYPSDQNEASEKQVMRVANVVADCLQITVEDITGRSHKREIVDARHIVIYLSVKMCGLPNARVCRVLGRDHTAGRSALQKVAGLLDFKDSEFTPKYKKCEEAFFREFLKV